MSWLKWNCGLTRKREILIMASVLSIRPVYVAAHFMLVMEWADGETDTGDIDGLPVSVIDECSQCPGFADAMISVGWIEVYDGGFRFVNYERHNGTSTKKRLAGTARQTRKRDRETALQMSHPERDKSNAPSVTKRREEKRREENTTATTTHTPKPNPTRKPGAAVAAAVEVVMGDGERATIADELAGGFWGLPRATAVQLAGTHDPPTLRGLMAQATGRHVRNPGGLLLSLLADVDPDRDAQMRRMDAESSAADAWVRGAKRDEVHAAVGEYLASSGEPSAKLSEVVKRPAFHRWLVNESGLCKTEVAQA